MANACSGLSGHCTSIVNRSFPTLPNCSTTRSSARGARKRAEWRSMAWHGMAWHGIAEHGTAAEEASLQHAHGRGQWACQRKWRDGAMRELFPGAGLTVVGRYELEVLD